MIEKSEKGWIQVVPIDQGTAEFDAEFWASRSPEERLSAVWEMVVLAHELKGGTEDELRLDRSHFDIQPIWNY